MFKDIFAFVDADYDVPTTDFEKIFFAHIKAFAFYDELNAVCKKNEGKDIDTLIGEGNYKAVAANMLKAEGLNYGQLPKGMLLFHNYDNGARTPMEEHLVEGALYAASKGEANVHFTVSHEHLPFFKQKVADKMQQYADKYGVKYNISFSEQKPSTDTIAANPDGTPFRNSDGSLLFRPGGHGALIENLNEIDADVIFIKNIDNVVPDRLKPETVEWKQIIAGVLVTLQKQAFEYMKVLDSGRYDHAKLEEIIRFVQQQLCCRKQDIKELEDAELVIYLKKKLNTSIILITHDLCIVAKECDSVAVVYAGEILEYAEKKALFMNPSHPYTIGLLGAIPDIYSQTRRLANIEGLPPDPSDLPAGCSFSPRCPRATDKCRTCKPDAVEIEPGHLCKCFFPGR